ncbi:MAG: oxygenase MpaB family protein [Moraxellaceae bacterium]|nr:oxygenase MpaB family protein [Moraxellaceae bacterium]
MTAVAHIDTTIPTRVPDPETRNNWRVRLLARLLTKDKLTPSPEQLADYLPFLNQGDPLADAVVAMYHDMKPGEGRRLVDQALEHGLASLDNPPEPLRAFFAQVETVPIWLDRDKCNLACDVTRRTGWFAELSLRNVSLMGGYLAAAAAKPLVFTGQLDRMAPRRLVETGKFWVDVTTRDGMLRQNEGFKSAVRVRLMHAQVRLMLNKSGRWDAAAWGHPINQSDSMATILEFSSVFLFGLRAVGFRFTTEEREAVIHLWRYVGYLMGVDERILPASEADSLRALWLQYFTVAESDEDSRALGQALSNVPMQQAGDHPVKKVMARIETGYRSAFTRLVLGNGSGDALGLPKSPLWTAAVLATGPAIFSLETLRRRVPGATLAAVAAGRLLHEKMLPVAIKLEKADTSFTPVRQLSR